MCGIAGYWQDRPAADAEQLAQTVTRMAATLSHRGPDAGGCWVDPADGIALGHRRLAIVDLSDAGAQPMRSADGRLVLSYNGELYNAPALRRELQQAGQAFSGHCDTEVVLNAFLVWGVEPALRRFNGMFALALWNANEKSLVLARDRVGKKPLYFGRGDGAWLFGSELKALRRHPGFNAEIDRDALALYLSYAWVPGPRSIYNGIEKLPAGHYLRITAGGNTSLHCYWSAFDAASTGEAQPFSGTLSQAADALEALLLEAVEQRMLADVGLGALLSGGIDSSTVTALMQSLSATPVQTFTIGFDDARYDESASARAIAAHLGTHHTEQLVTPQDAMALIPALPAMYDEPFADASQIPTHLVSRLARESVTVALSGDGGDELFAGPPAPAYRRGGSAGARRTAHPLRSAASARCAATRRAAAGYDAARFLQLPGGRYSGESGPREHGNQPGGTLTAAGLPRGRAGLEPAARAAQRCRRRQTRAARGACAAPPAGFDRAPQTGLWRAGGRLAARAPARLGRGAAGPHQNP